MMILKKKEIIAAALVVLIGCAGYLNWSYQDTMTVRDGESYIETGRRLGEAQLVNSEAENVEAQSEDADEVAEETAADTQENAEVPAVETQSDSDGSYFENARYERENSRAKSLEILNQTCANDSFDEETRRKAGDKIIAETDNINAEQEIESIAQSKGYSDICVYVSDGSATVMVKKEAFGEEDAIKLSELVCEKSDLSADAVKIVEVK